MQPAMKVVGEGTFRHVYLHVSAVEEPGNLNESDRDLVLRAIQISGLGPGADFNAVKISTASRIVSLLDYPTFFDDAFPSLARSWSVDTNSGSVSPRSYERSLNPPILHRKELLLPSAHPLRGPWSQLTALAEDIGLFDEPSRIGFRAQFDELLAQRSYRVVGHSLVPIGNDLPARQVDDLQRAATPTKPILRHLTALARNSLSAPIQAVMRAGLLESCKTVFDFGCGRGDDVRGLQAIGVRAQGWDPHYSPDTQCEAAHIVNIGFVLNVIENVQERIEALKRAYDLATEVLVVAVMLNNQDSSRGTPFGDGHITSRGTFQKYFSQSELKLFITTHLKDEPISAGPGIFLIFRDKLSEQRFLLGRQAQKRNVARLTLMSLQKNFTAGVPRAPRPPRQTAANRDLLKYAAHQPLFDQLWERWLQLGRAPEPAELEHADSLIAAAGSLSRAHRLVRTCKPDFESMLGQSRLDRIDELRVYFALEAFARRKAYKNLDPTLQRDIRSFFGDYSSAMMAGRELLFSVSDVTAIRLASHQAAEWGIGYLKDETSLQLHQSLVGQLPPILRAYIGCGSTLFGDIAGIDLIKIHIESGKLTLMKFDDFEGQPLPRMLQRTKIDMRRLTMDVFDYGENFPPPYLYQKSRFINEEFPHFSEQLAFDEALENLGIFDFSEYGPDGREFNAVLERLRYTIEDFQVKRSSVVPLLDSNCGAHFTFRHFIECGETQRKTSLPNQPREPETYNALADLARFVVDPIIDYFGPIELTFGFCSHELARAISSRIAPHLDQHASHERSRRGDIICPRLGAACDLLVRDEDMSEVADWIIANTPFDRLYFYGADRPVHVSWSERPARVAIDMVKAANGRLLPRRRAS
ncbi:DNA phosphorothioation-associated putative methyltransferase [Burkholderia pseudomallei]|nr:DNA phosphorothioation-associated putative methyltransferase [Burkholderia pseudomallei]